MMYGYGYGPGVMNGFGGLFGFGMMTFFGLLIIAGIVLVVVWLVRSSSHGTAGSASTAENDRAMAIARERCARGEITTDEYEKIKATLGG
jgi:putative membrane protein